MNDLISVIIPAYNIAAALPSCLDSILAQNYKNIEIIVVDDGSVDNTGEIIDRYAAENDRIIAIHKENGGVTSARLCGLSRAGGEWIGFVDGDDMIDPDMYERLLKNAKEYDADISHCGYRMCFPNGRVDYYYNTGTFLKQDRATALNELLSGARIEPGLWNKLFHKKLFENLVMPTDIKSFFFHFREKLHKKGRAIERKFAGDKIDHTLIAFQSPITSCSTFCGLNDRIYTLGNSVCNSRKKISEDRFLMFPQRVGNFLHWLQATSF